MFNFPCATARKFLKYSNNKKRNIDNAKAHQ